MWNLKLKMRSGICLTAALLALTGPLASATAKNTSEMTTDDFRGLQASSMSGNPIDAMLLAPAESMTVAPVIVQVQYYDDDYYEDEEEDEYYDDEEDEYQPSVAEIFLQGMNKGLQQSMPLIEDGRRREAERQAQYDADVQRQIDEYRAQQEHNARMMALQQAQMEAARQSQAQQQSTQQGSSSNGNRGNMEGCSWSAGNNIWVCN